MKEPNKSIPNYIHIFDGKLEHLKKRIEKEYDKPKKERSREKLKSFIKEAKKLQNAIHRVKEEHSKRCPHCGEKI